MNLEAEVVINKMNNLLWAKHEKDPDFPEKRKNWAFFISIPLFIKLKRVAGDYKGIGAIALMREVSLEILGCEVFGVDGLIDDAIYLAEKLSIKKN